MSAFVVFDVQPTAGRILHTAAARDRLAQAYLFYGPEGTGKWAAALRAAQLIMCPRASEAVHDDCSTCHRIASYNHPDVHWILPLMSKDKEKAETDDPAGQELSDARENAQIREFLQIIAAKREDPWVPLDYPRRPYITLKWVRELESAVHRTPTEGPRKVGIIVNAETILPNVQSVLLKTIEEPPADTHLILTTSDKSTLLPTILSRCQPVRFLPLPPQAIADCLVRELNLAPDRARQVAELSGGGWSRACRLAGEDWELWRRAADMILNTTATESVDTLVQTIDTIFKQRPDLNKVLFLFEVWHMRLHRAALNLSTTSVSIDSGEALQSILQSCAVLDQASAAVIGNVTPRTALAAAWLELHRRLHPLSKRVIQQIMTTI